MASYTKLSNGHEEWDGGVLHDEYTPKQGRRYDRLFLGSCLLVSIAVNVWMFRQGGLSCNPVSTPRHVVSYSGLKHDVPTTYSYHTEYWNESGGLSEEKWDAISIDPAVIAVTPEWAEQKDLPPSWNFPWDPSKRMYFLKVYHQLHCLKSFRKAIEEYKRDGESSIGYDHLAHCLDSLRQDIMCYADDTPMPSPRLFDSLGDGQVTMCRDFNKLSEWALHPDRQSCHKHLLEYKPIHHGIERFAFCPLESPYYPKMAAYFEKHGHVDPGA